MLLAALCSSSMNALIRGTSDELHAFEIAFFRNLFGLVALVPMLLGAGAGALKTSRFGLHALRGVLCQALMPALDGDRYYLATESLTVNPEVAAVIESGNVADLRNIMEHKAAPGCHTMNECLRKLLAEKKVSIEDARHATTDRLGFADTH